jgi:hypothetical protein
VAVDQVDFGVTLGVLAAALFASSSLIRASVSWWSAR